MRVAPFAVFVLMILSLTISVLPTALLAQQKPPVPATELQESAKSGHRNLRRAVQTGQDCRGKRAWPRR